MTLLEARDVAVHFGPVRAVDGVSLAIARGETLGLVGESGCGKSTLGRALLQLIRPTSGSVWLDGADITSAWRRRLGVWRFEPAQRDLRKRMQLVFQDPYASLNPRMTLEAIIGEPLGIFGLARGLARRRKVQELMEQVGLDPRYVRRYPHELSGGQRQRVSIARALAVTPELLVLDEPVSALDVSIQAQILNLLQDLQKSLGLTYLFIAHDLAVVRHVSSRIAVMYLGRIVETAEADAIYRAPKHPYTQGLIAAVPIPDPTEARRRGSPAIRGELPSPSAPPTGCAFHPRCPIAVARCKSETPALREITPGHAAACHLASPP